MGVPNDKMAFFTSLIYLPWVLKPLWSPFVDFIKTKRWWIILMQVIMAAAMILTILAIPHPAPEVIAAKGTSIAMFTTVLILFIITAFASATHDIAADGFYMLALDQNQQAAFVGVRSVFYRLSNVFCNSAVVILAGVLTRKSGSISMGWQITMVIVAALFTLISLYHFFLIPKPASDMPRQSGEKAKGTDLLKDIISQPFVWFLVVAMGLLWLTNNTSIFGKLGLTNIENTLSSGIGNVAFLVGCICLIVVALAIMLIAYKANPPKARTDVGNTFNSFFKKSAVALAIIFMLLYRLPEAFLLKLIYPFMHDPIDMGGLAMSDEMFGTIYGAVGVIFLLLGGVLGGVFAARVGLKKAFWWMAAAMTLPCLTFVYLSSYFPSYEELLQIANSGLCQTLNEWSGINLFGDYYGFNITPDTIKNVLVAIGVSIEQFGYGFGFTAYMLYMMYFSEGEFKTAHYAICTAFMSLSMMLPGMIAGQIQKEIGYSAFFWMVIICCVAPLVITFIAHNRVDANYGKK